MYLNILKKDLKRKKTMNFILLMFIILAVTFAASGLNNVLTVMNGTDYYLDKAGIGDLTVITMGSESAGKASSVLDKADCVKSYKIEECISGSENCIRHKNGTKAKTKNNPLFQSISNAKMNFFDENNNAVSEVKPGEVMIAGSFIEQNDLKIGDEIIVRLGDVQIDLKIAGKIKDAFLGSDFMGNTRFLLNQTDYARLAADEEIYENGIFELIYIETDDLKSAKAVVGDIPKVAFTGDRDLLKMCYVMEMIVALVVLILSICLIIVSFVVLRFSIGFTIAEEYREIGVMKAIGLKNRKIRSLYIIKYLIMSIFGGIIGFFASIPFGDMIIQSSAKNMMIGNNAGLLINIASTIGTICIILMFAYSCTGKVRKFTPIDAIRCGQNGERFRKKSFLRLGKTKSKPSFYMALNDILSAPRRFMTIIISFFICTLFVLILVNTVSTMKSPNLISTFGTKSDLYISGIDEFMGLESAKSKKDVENKLERIADEITADGMPCKVSVDIYYKYKVSSDENEISVSCAQSVGIRADEYEYTKGTAPKYRNEIAITPQISETLGVRIGDTVTIDFGSEKIDCIVTAYFQTMNNLGELIRLSDEAPADMKFVSATRQYQVDFTDDPSDKEIESRKERIKKLYDNAKVMNAAEYCMDCTSVVPTLEAVQYLLLTITIIVVILVTILVERSFISDERSQIAILKAIGFTNGTIVKWHTLRFGIAALAAAILAAIASIPMTNLCITPVFGMMGASDIDFNIEPLKIFLIYPAVIFAVTIASAWITALHTRRIKTSEATNIE